MSTPRFEVNGRVAQASSDFEAWAIHLLKKIKILNNFNFDLRKLSHQQGLEHLENSLTYAKFVKDIVKNTQKSLDDMNFILDWYIQRHSMDIKKVRGRIDGEATEAEGGICQRNPENS